MISFTCQYFYNISMSINCDFYDLLTICKFLNNWGYDIKLEFAVKHGQYFSLDSRRVNEVRSVLLLISHCFAVAEILFRSIKYLAFEAHRILVFLEFLRYWKTWSESDTRNPYQNIREVKCIPVFSKKFICPFGEKAQMNDFSI